MTAYSNDWYLKGIKAKDREVIQTIFQEYLPVITRYIRSNSGNEEDARDIFMDAMEALFRKLRSEELVLTSKFSTFLFEVCKRLWLKQLRRKKLRSGVTIDNPRVSSISVEMDTPIEETEQYKLLREKFASLQEDCRKILSLSWHTDKDMETIAKEMGLTYAYVRKRKHLCKERLIEMVKGDSRYKELKG